MSSPQVPAVRAPSEPPSAELLTRLRDTLAAHPDITAAYLAELVSPGALPSQVVGLNYSGAPERGWLEHTLLDIITELGSRMPGEQLDFIVLQKDDLAPAIVEHGLLVYERKLAE